MLHERRFFFLASQAIVFILSCVYGRSLFAGYLTNVMNPTLGTRAGLLLEARQADCGLVRGAGTGFVRSRGILRLTGRASLAAWARRADGGLALGPGAGLVRGLGYTLHAAEAADKGAAVGCVELDSSVSQSATSGRG